MLLIVCNFFFYCNTMRCLQSHYKVSTESLQPTTESLQPTMDSLQTLYTLLWLSTDSLQPLQPLYRLSTATLQRCCCSAAVVLCRT